MVGGGTDLSAGEAARLLRIGKTQVHRMCEEDRLTGFRTDGGHRRIEGASVARVLLARPASPARDEALAELRALGVDVDGLAAD